jgi:hypothetical protein
MRQAVAQIATRDRHHQAQVRQHHLLGGAQVILFAQVAGQLDLFFVGQHGQAVHCRDIRVDIAQAAGKTQRECIGLGRHECSLCRRSFHGFSLFLPETV